MNHNSRYKINAHITRVDAFLDNVLVPLIAVLALLAFLVTI